MYVLCIFVCLIMSSLFVGVEEGGRFRKHHAV